jgi:type II secretory pathway pseudopilin PulG
VDSIKCISSRLLHAARRQAGVTLVETVVAIAMFAIVSTAMITVLTSATYADGLSRQRSIALELGQQQIEYVRQLSYADVCIVGGNPSCPAGVTGVTPILQKRVMGLWYQLKTSVRWVNDTVSTGVATAANYKRVRVTVSRLTDNKQLALVYTFVANPSQTNVGGINNAIINVYALDYGCTIGDGCTTNSNPVYVQGAQIDLWDGPSPHASDVTDQTGSVTFAGLLPNPADSNGNLLTSGATAYYDILASFSGYQTLREDLPPGTVPVGTGTGPVSAAHIQINPSQTQTANIRMYQPATIYVHLTTDGSTPYTGNAIVDIGALYPRCAQEFSPTSSPAVTGGSLSIVPPATIGGPAGPCAPLGEQPVSGVTYTIGARSTDGTLVATAVQKSVPNSYPADLTSTFTLTLQPITTKSCTLTVKKSGVAVSGARVDVIDGPQETPPAPQAYVTTVTNGSGVATFTLPVTSDFDVYVYSSSGNGGLTNQVVPSSGTCTFPQVNL